MKIVDDMPTNGQFIQTWSYQGKLWAATLKWIDGRLMEYIADQIDKWDDYDELRHDVKNIRYIIE